MFPNVAASGTVVGSTSSNQVPAGSVITIKLATDSSGNITGATFSITDPSGSTSAQPWQQFAGQPEPANFAAFPIYGFQVNLVSPPSSACTFTSGAGTLTYSVSPGVLSVQTVNTCGGSQPGTGENSNIVYQGVSPASGSTLTQSFATPAIGIEFNFEKSTFGQDEVKQALSWGPAYWLAISGFPNSALGFDSQSALGGPPNPSPTITAAINNSLNPGLNHGQIATIASNLPVVNTSAQPPVQAIDDTLGLNYQTFFVPFTISFPNLNAFNALNPHQVALVAFDRESDGASPHQRQLPWECRHHRGPAHRAGEHRAREGGEPYFFDLNPTDPHAYPSWLSFDLRLFTVTPTQSHQMFSVPNPTTGDPSSANGPITYIQTVLNHLNNPSLITNGDTFDNALTQDEEGSAIVFFPNNDAFVPSFNFAVARVRITSSITTTIGPVRVFFRLFNAASTVSNFTEVGTGQGTYRWGTNGTPGHRIPLLGVQGPLIFGAEYVTIPCFATERVNLNQPADMKTQTDPPNAQSITTAAGKEVDTYFGCWLDVNQSTPFLIPTPPLLPPQWDGPWTGTKSLNGVISTAPHQCLIAEIRFDDTPIPNGATTSTSDKLAQRNIAWLGTQP